MRFLIVDDNPADRELIVRRLAKAFDDATFVEIGRSVDFEATLEHGDFDVVLTDYHLHWSDGLEVFRRVRKRYPEIPVIMFTDSGNEEIAVEGMKLGLDDYLLKRHLERLSIAVRESLAKIALEHKYEAAMEELRASRKRYRTISDLTSDYAFAYQVDEEGYSTREWVTDAFYRITGYTEEELDAAGGWMHVLYPEDVPLAQEHRRRILANEEHSVEYRIITKGGQVRWLQVKGRPIWDEDEGRVVQVLGAARDVTERRWAAEALRASEARFRTVFENAGIGIALLNEVGRILTVNPTLARILRYDETAITTKTFMDLTHPDDLEADLALFKELAADERDGYSMEKRYLRSDGEVIWGRLIATKAKDETGQTYYVGMVEDITERREAQQALMQAEKLSVAGRLAASLAHEINNPMQTVIGCLGLAEETLAENDDVNRYLHMAAQEMERAARIVAELRDLGRKSTLEEREPTKLGELVDRVLTLSGKEFANQGVEVEVQSDGESALVMAVPDRLHQVFLNLVLNALDAMPEGGRLTIRFTPTGSPEGVSVSFQDTGVGIPPESRDQLFDPFFTTKENGVGLGLYIINNIVQDHQGTIEVQSEPDAGTTFRIWLPKGEVTEPAA